MKKTTSKRSNKPAAPAARVKNLAPKSQPKGGLSAVSMGNFETSMGNFEIQRVSSYTRG